jgi:hypothetical protein
MVHHRRNLIFVLRSVSRKYYHILRILRHQQSFVVETDKSDKQSFVIGTDKSDKQSIVSLEHGYFRERPSTTVPYGEVQC